MRPTVGPDELEAIRRVFDSKFLTEGDVTAEFEKRVADYLGVKHAVAVTSCTTALELALQVTNISNGSEVMIPDFTHLATGDAVLNVGAKPILVDVSDRSFNIDFNIPKSCFSRKTRCIIPVSLFGRPIDLDGLEDFRDKHDMIVIEDAACSFGAQLNGRKVGTFADITCFSFHPRKLITTGEGGMLVTNNEEYAELARSIKNFGLGKRNGQLRGIRRGSNHKLSNILAAIGLVQLSKFEEVLAERIKRADFYNRMLGSSGNLQIPDVPQGMRCTYQSYCVLLKRDGMRDKVRRRMIEQGIEVQLGTNALHQEPIFSRAKKANLKRSPRVFANTLTLPLHNELSHEAQQHVVNVLNESIESILKEQ